MKIPFLNIWVTRVDWEHYFKCSDNQVCELIKDLTKYEKWKSQPRVDGKFVKDTRTKFKKIHDQLRAEVAARDTTACDCTYDELKGYSK